jgi:hypothetical protein
MKAAANAAKPFPSTANAFPGVTEPTPVNPADPLRQLPVRLNLTNKSG